MSSGTVQSTKKHTHITQKTMNTKRRTYKNNIQYVVIDSKRDVACINCALLFNNGTQLEISHKQETVNRSTNCACYPQTIQSTHLRQNDQRTANVPNETKQNEKSLMCVKAVNILNESNN